MPVTKRSHRILSPITRVYFIMMIIPSSKSANIILSLKEIHSKIVFPLRVWANICLMKQQEAIINLIEQTLKRNRINLRRKILLWYLSLNKQYKYNKGVNRAQISGPARKFLLSARPGLQLIYYKFILWFQKNFWRFTFC